MAGFEPAAFWSRILGREPMFLLWPLYATFIRTFLHNSGIFCIFPVSAMVANPRIPLLPVFFDTPETHLRGQVPK